MSFSQVITNGFQTTLNVFGKTGDVFFNTRDRFRSSFLIVANIAQEILLRHPTSKSGLKALEKSCSSVNLFYGLEFLTVPLSYFSKNKEIKDKEVMDKEIIDLEAMKESLGQILRNRIQKNERSEKNSVDEDTIREYANAIFLELGVSYTGIEHRATVGYFKRRVLEVKEIPIDMDYFRSWKDPGLFSSEELIDALKQVKPVALKTNKTFFEKVLETGLNISELTVVTGSFLFQLNDWELVNLSKWSSSIGRLPGLKFVDQIKLDNVIVVGCFSIMVLDIINNVKKLIRTLENEDLQHSEAPLKGYYKDDLCSLAQAGLGSLYFGGLVLSLKYKKFDQPSLFRAAAVTRHFLSGIVLDYIKSH